MQLDGVVFAAAWESHTITRGKNPRPVMRRMVGKNWKYMEMDEYERRHGGPEKSDADRMLADPAFDVTDQTSRNILADALADSTPPRDQEATMLRSHVGETLLVRGGRLVEPHRVPIDDAIASLTETMNAIPGSQHAGGWRTWMTIEPGVADKPAGTVRVTWTDNPSMEVARSYPVAAVLAAARRYKTAGYTFYPSGFRDSIINFMVDHLNETGSQDTFSSNRYAVQWAHLRFSRSEGMEERKEHSAGPTQYEFRSVPMMSGKRGHYYVRHAPDTNPLVAGLDVGGELYPSPHAAVRAAGFMWRGLGASHVQTD